MFLYIFHDGLSCFFLSVAYLLTDLGTAVLDHFTPMMRFELRRDEFAIPTQIKANRLCVLTFKLAIGVSQEISQSVLAHVTIKSSENIHKKGFSFHSHDASSFSPSLQFNEPDLTSSTFVMHNRSRATCI